ncbi:RagB/SusD family nutrient uptake outer membrane protein [Echinicola jeungdonensis]|uniref:RagB/SusD family nutrient uptake outer membrane protein n=1 Tax=Echinicola jeungdonensis TaxID=709343 RepID=A0ABV5J387_9BACT|nr:RagB/SusD family nutrient uptake outer membrane protein [Echinicola jeungdonensis]MDN3668924.1 RagB/SusD family nutrient uptake outer membrane protein [Echinicola jeungdonensis]
METNYKRIFLLGLLILVLGGCTDLDEELFGRLSPDNYYRTEEEALSSVVGVYQSLSRVADVGDAWRISEFGTDEFFVPGRASGGWFDEYNMEIMRHEVTPQNSASARAWSWYIFPAIGRANAVIQSLEDSPNSDQLQTLIAETRALRAYAYFYAMDFWGNVPIFTEARVDPENLPTTNTRQEVFDFVVSEMEAAAEVMPSVNDVDRSSYYPRFTKEAVYAALATIYLNGEVYTGTPHWEDALANAERVINSGAFSLEERVQDCFLATNESNSPEIIVGFSIDPNRNAGANQFILYTQHALTKEKYDLPFTPANGYSTGPIALNRYEDRDERKAMIEHGPQYYSNGEPMLLANGEQLELIPIQDMTAAEDNEGFKVLKYSPEGVSWSGFNADNDFVLIRYSDMLLIKAECLFRLGNHGEALNLVNQVRERSNATLLSSLTLDDIEDERAREFLWEGHRRRDMIRFGSYFTDTFGIKTGVTEEWRGIYPIPAEQIVANPMLDQNPNYPNQ